MGNQSSPPPARLCLLPRKLTFAYDTLFQRIIKFVCISFPLAAFLFWNPWQIAEWGVALCKTSDLSNYLQRSDFSIAVSCSPTSAFKVIFREHCLELWEFEGNMHLIWNMLKVRKPYRHFYHKIDSPFLLSLNNGCLDEISSRHLYLAF